MNRKEKKKESLELLFHYKYVVKNKIWIGVTGTEGKTTTATLIYSFLKQYSHAAYFGSNGIYIDDIHYNNPNTTCELKLLLSYLNKKIKYVIVEISSISFYEYRLFGLHFNYIILTNIHEDHLEYHKRLYDYQYTKLLILATNFEATSIIPIDTPFFDKLYRLNINTISYGLLNGDIHYDSYKMEESGYSLSIQNEKYITHLNGEYNLKNILAFYTLAIRLGYKETEIGPFLKEFKGVLGRYEEFISNGIHIIIDYPHTEKSYQAILEAIKQKACGKIITIFGCGGNRQKSKREKIAKLVEKYSDYIVVTNDNIRDENEMDIVKDIQKGFTKNHPYISQRKEAILDGLAHAQKNDYVLILGKGREEAIIEGDKVYNHSDILFIKTLI